MAVDDPQNNADAIRDRAYQAYRLMAEEASDIVMLHEPDGSVLFASSALQRILKHTAAKSSTANSFRLFIPTISTKR